MKAGATDWIEVVTGRVGKITALLTALGGLLVVVLNQSDQFLKKLRTMELFPSYSCVEIDKVVIPQTVEYSEWENMRIGIGGRNNCKESLGLYVTFQERVSNEPRFRLRAPYEGQGGCGSESVQLPGCWDYKKPVAVGKWGWEVLPPPMTQLNNPVPTAKITVRWDVRNVDQPDKHPLASDSAQIEVTNKAARP